MEIPWIQASRSAGHFYRRRWAPGRTMGGPRKWFRVQGWVWVLEFGDQGGIPRVHAGGACSGITGCPRFRGVGVGF